VRAQAAWPRACRTPARPHTAALFSPSARRPPRASPQLSAVSLGPMRARRWRAPGRCLPPRAEPVRCIATSAAAAGAQPGARAAAPPAAPGQAMLGGAAPVGDAAHRAAANALHGAACCRALVLDSSYRPIEVVNWQRAICLDLFDKARPARGPSPRLVRSLAALAQTSCPSRLQCS